MSNWKKHSGYSSGRNVRASTVLFSNSNFWQKGQDLEIYHNNDGATTYVGIGTQQPFSRLSMGNTAKGSRPQYANDAVLAFSENPDGTNATGIGFYEKYKEDDTSSLRNFCGLKFMVNINNDSQGNINNEEDHNVKMLIRDDGKVLIAHNPNETTALEPYNIAALDVSGSIRTNEVLILNTGGMQRTLHFDLEQDAALPSRKAFLSNCSIQLLIPVVPSGKKYVKNT